MFARASTISQSLQSHIDQCNPQAFISLFQTAIKDIQLHTKDETGRTLLHYALEKAATLHDDKRFNIPLFLVMQMFRLKTDLCLVQSTNAQGETYLHLIDQALQTTTSGHVEAFKAAELLIRRNIGFAHKNAARQTPLQNEALIAHLALQGIFIGCDIPGNILSTLEKIASRQKILLLDTTVKGTLLADIRPYCGAIFDAKSALPIFCNSPTMHLSRDESTLYYCSRAALDEKNPEARLFLEYISRLNTTAKFLHEEFNRYLQLPDRIAAKKVPTLPQTTQPLKEISIALPTERSQTLELKRLQSLVAQRIEEFKLFNKTHGIRQNPKKAAALITSITLLWLIYAVAVGFMINQALHQKIRPWEIPAAIISLFVLLPTTGGAHLCYKKLNTITKSSDEWQDIHSQLTSLLDGNLKEETHYVKMNLAVNTECRDKLISIQETLANDLSLERVIETLHKLNAVLFLLDTSQTKYVSTPANLWNKKTLQEKPIYVPPGLTP